MLARIALTVEAAVREVRIKYEVLWPGASGCRAPIVLTDHFSNKSTNAFVLQSLNVKS